MQFVVRFAVAVLSASLLFFVGCATTDKQSRDSLYERERAPGGSVASGQTGARVRRSEAPADAGSARTHTRDRSESAREQKTETPAAPPQEFRDFTTGLAYTRPWYIVTTEWAGPILGKEGRSHMTVRFTTLTIDKRKAAQPRFLYTTAKSVAEGVAYGLQTL